MCKTIIFVGFIFCGRYINQEEFCGLIFADHLELNIAPPVGMFTNKILHLASKI